MSNPIIVVGSYDNRHRAELDYSALSTHRAEIDGERAYAVALVERSETGKVKVVNHFEPGTEYSAIAGTVVGGLVGLLYPPLVPITAAAGLGVARAAAHLWHGVSRKDLADLGVALDTGEGAVLVMARKLPQDIDAVLPHATHIVHRAMTHQHEDIEAMVTELREAHDAAPAVLPS
ncbi:MAG TPA: DUF1269 domain-containing protein [Actinomycetes bacterium]|nr:DUF1269 domain-containing protein [Actinomycetes bacterium]